MEKVLKRIKVTLNGNTYFHTSESIEALYFALPDVVWKLVLAVCFGTGTLTTTPSANILAPKTLLTYVKKNEVHVAKIDCDPRYPLMYICLLSH